MSLRLVPAPISILFSEVAQTDELFEREYQLLSGADDDAIGQWLKLAKAKGDTQETDKVLLQLMVEMHRKIDKLEQLIKNEKPKRVDLDQDEHINAIGFEHFQLDRPMMQSGSRYYGRMEMPVYPQRDVAIFFEALSPTEAKIMRMHERDITEWNAYVTARERIMIRDLKGRS